MKGASNTTYKYVLIDFIGDISCYYMKTEDDTPNKPYHSFTVPERAYSYYKKDAYTCYIRCQTFNILECNESKLNHIKKIISWALARSEQSITYSRKSLDDSQKRIEKKIGEIEQLENNNNISEIQIKENEQKIGDHEDCIKLELRISQNCDEDVIKYETTIEINTIALEAIESELKTIEEEKKNTKGVEIIKNDTNITKIADCKKPAQQFSNGGAENSLQDTTSSTDENLKTM